MQEMDGSRLALMLRHVIGGGYMHVGSRLALMLRLLGCLEEGGARDGEREGPGSGGETLIQHNILQRGKGEEGKGKKRSPRRMGCANKTAISKGARGVSKKKKNAQDGDSFKSKPWVGT